MNRLKAVMVLTTALAGAVAADSALARGHFVHARVGVGISIGVPLYYGPRYYAPAPYYYPPAYYYPAPAYYPPVVRPAPQTYIEQSPNEVALPPAPQASSSPSQGWWYYCAGSKSYYPYVKSCAGAWERVSPTPPAGSGG